MHFENRCSERNQKTDPLSTTPETQAKCCVRACVCVCVCVSRLLCWGLLSFLRSDFHHSTCMLSIVSSVNNVPVINLERRSYDYSLEVSFIVKHCKAVSVSDTVLWKSQFIIIIILLDIAKHITDIPHIRQHCQMMANNCNCTHRRTVFEETMATPTKPLPF